MRLVFQYTKKLTISPQTDVRLNFPVSFILAHTFTLSRYKKICLIYSEKQGNIVMHSGADGLFFGGGFMWILWIILAVILVFVLMDFVGSANRRGKDDDALEILKQRYARGEIDEQEFEKRKNELQK